MSKHKLRLIGQYTIKNKQDAEDFKAMVAEQAELTSAYDLLHSFTPHPTSKQIKINTYLKVEKEEDSGREGCVNIRR